MKINTNIKKGKSPIEICEKRNRRDIISLFEKHQNFLLWQPTSHRLYPRSKNHFVETFLLSSKIFQKNSHLSIPKPILFHIINRIVKN